MPDYDVSNPHPGFGKDPNILNEFGHTMYPKWVNGVIVQNEKEETKLIGKKVEKPTKPVGWGEE